MSTKQINIRFLKQGLLKTSVPANLSGEELVEYCKNILDNTSDQELINALADVDPKSRPEYGMFDSDSFDVECIEDSESFDVIYQTKLWKHYGLEDSYLDEQKEYISMQESENKAMAEYLEQLGFDQNSIDNIASGNKERYVVHVVNNNKLELYKNFTTKEQCTKEYIELSKRWYMDDGVANFRERVEELELSEVELFDEYHGSEEYYDSGDNCKVTWEVLHS